MRDREQILARFAGLLEDARLDSVRLQRLDNPGRGEEPAFQVILNPKPRPGRKACHAILRTPQAALRRALEAWESQFPDEGPPDIEDLLK